MKKTAQNIMFTKLAKFGVFAKKNISKWFTKSSNQPSIFIFQNLSQINIELWNEILTTQNINLLDKEFATNKKYNQNEIKLLNDKFTELYDEYFKQLNNHHAKNNLKETQEKIQLSAKIMVLTDCINSLFSIQRNFKVIKDPIKKENQIYECVKILSKYVKFDKFNTITENIEIIKKLLISNETTYKRKFGETETEFKEKTYTFEKQVVDVEQVLGHAIDTTKVNVLKWIGYINLAQEISKKRIENGRS